MSAGFLWQKGVKKTSAEAQHGCSETVVHSEILKPALIKLAQVLQGVIYSHINS